ncbi:MAG: toll/interleukin-1 receptor domain-containing protein [Propionibacteriaceae bacterium]|nr:toll/interleukin-1 receptor domain-containing protein [Propionibacteriaceae bacterium]
MRRDHIRVPFEHGRTTVRALVENLESAGGRVWLDQDLTGGEAWWSAILNQIRDCSVFVFALSENSLNSEACLLELKHARDLGRAILPVQIGDLPGLRDHIIFSYQSIDYRQPTASAGIALARAVHEREQNVPPLPDPLPDAPPIPYEYLMLLGTAIQGRTPLSFNEQDSIVRQLRQALRDEKNETILGNVRSLLKTLRQRPEVTFVTVNEINALLGDDAPAAQVGQQPVAQQQVVQHPVTPQPTPYPTGRRRAGTPIRPAAHSPGIGTGRRGPSRNSSSSPRSSSCRNSSTHRSSSRPSSSGARRNRPARASRSRPTSAPRSPWGSPSWASSPSAWASPRTPAKSQPDAPP